MSRYRKKPVCQVLLKESQENSECIISKERCDLVSVDFALNGNKYKRRSKKKDVTKKIISEKRI